uniref:Large ribosomal subunit protein bL9c n=1 Tax=Corynoplastis japonica TaxID=700918 RepID=A0A1Y9TMI6_9RHOD|nr:50S ribosomal protein L9 [Corynoplastis japonica]
MAKNYIKVLLNKDVNSLGLNGELLNVSHGYARNYLFPKKLAVPATQKSIETIEKQKAIQIQETLKQKEIAKERRKSLELVEKFTLRKKAGKDNLLFGIVTSKEILDLIYQQTGEIIDKKQIKLSDIKEVGIYPISIQFYTDIIANIKLQVLPIID